MPQELDLNEVLQNRATIAIDPLEGDDERAERLRKERWEHTADVIKGYVVFFVIIGALVAVGSVCCREAVFDKDASPETKKWAQTALTALFSGSISFALGNAIGKKK